MWKSEADQCRAIRALLGQVHLGRLWTESGPTVEATDLLMQGGGPLSHGGQVMLKVAFDLWNGGGKATLADIVDVLDNKNLFAVGSLLVELSSRLGPDVEGWLELIHDEELAAGGRR